MPGQPSKRRRVRQLIVAASVAGIVLYGLSALAKVAETTPAATNDSHPLASRMPDLPPRRQKTQPAARLMHVVALLTRRRALVYCWSSADWQRQTTTWPSTRLGPLSTWRAYTTLRPVPAVNLPPNVCTELELLRDSHAPVWKSTSPAALAWSLQSLTHEAIHVSGITSEVKAECHGMQMVPAAAVALGRTRIEGQYLARLYWKYWYQRIQTAYRSSECRNGARLDLHPGSLTWP